MYELGDADRRTVLKTLPAAVIGTGILGSAEGTVQRNARSPLHASESTVEGVAGDDEETIDPMWGYSTTDPAAVPEDLEPDHQVDLFVAPPAEEGGTPFFVFDPVGIHVETEDVVQFNMLSPDHTVTAMHPDIGPGPRVPDESPPFSSPVLGPGMAWLYRFEHEGVYDVYCAPHLNFGMVMRLVAGDLAEEDLPEYALSVEDLPSQEDVSQGLNMLSEENEGCVWPFLMPAGILGTEALDPMAIQESGQVPFSSVAAELGYEFQPPGPDDGVDGPDGDHEGGEGEGYDEDEEADQ